MSAKAGIDCSECGARNDDGARFCSMCGARLLPPHLEERIQPTTDEFKTVTMLVADIVRSSELGRNLDAEARRQPLVTAVNVMADVVDRYEGVVIRDEGDGVTASFGAPIALEDHAVRACYAALDMHRALHGRASEVLGAQVRIGISSGSALVDVTYNRGKVQRIRIDGDPVIVAKRLEPLAAAGRTLLSADTLKFGAEGYVGVRALGRHALKGFDAPFDVYELEGIKTRARIHALGSRGLSKFVGREREIGILRARAARAATGAGQIVALAGEAGVGKSRMLLEFIRSAQMAGWRVLEAHSLSYARTTSYLPLVELSTRYFELDELHDAQSVRDRIARKLDTFGEIALLPCFLALLGMAPGDTHWAKLPPHERRDAMFDAIARVLIHESRRQPLCVVFEDLHWIDAESRAFLESLLESLQTARLMLLVNYRPDPEYVNPWAGAACFTELRIAPLPPTSAGEMLGTLLGSDSSLDPIKQRLIEETRGNPLFLEEGVRTLMEVGVLAGERGQMRPLAEPPPHIVPPTIASLIDARIDRLEPKKLKDVLRCAAVIGSDIPKALLQSVTELSESELDEGLRQLQSAEFLYEQGVSPVATYAFKHAITRERAYEGLLQGQKRALNARAAEALEKMAAGREDQVERIGTLAELGGLWGMAADYLHRAGAKAYGLYGNQDAAKFFERALKALSHLPESPESLQQAVDFRFELRNALIALCDLGRIRQILEELEPLLATLGDDALSARHAAFRCNDYFLAAEQRRVIEVGEAGLDLSRKLGNRAIEGELLYRIGQAYHAVGDNRHAVVLLQESVEYTPEDRPYDRFELSVIPAVVNRTWLAAALTECGAFQAARTHANRALAIAESSNHPLSQVLALLATGRLLLRKGDLDGAIDALERGRTLCSHHTLPIWRLRLLSSLGLAYACCGRVGEGFELAQEALAGAEQMRLIVDQPASLVHLGMVRLAAGHAADAAAYGKRALALASAQEARPDEGWSRLLIARALLAAGDTALDEAALHADTARELARACEARPLEALCHAALASIHSRHGNEAEAQQHAAVAAAIYRELDMRPLVPLR